MTTIARWGNSAGEIGRVYRDERGLRCRTDLPVSEQEAARIISAAPLTDSATRIFVSAEGDASAMADNPERRALLAAAWAQVEALKVAYDRADPLVPDMDAYEAGFRAIWDAYWERVIVLSAEAVKG
ncbi:MAG: hypothetical protein ACYDAG_05690 [Chloroflexota bacterium]